MVIHGILIRKVYRCEREKWVKRETWRGSRRCERQKRKQSCRGEMRKENGAVKRELWMSSFLE